MILLNLKQLILPRCNLLHKLKKKSYMNSLNENLKNEFEPSLKDNSKYQGLNIYGNFMQTK